MGGPRIMVFHVKQLIKTGIFALVGLVIIIALIWALTPKNTAQTQNGGMSINQLYNPGTYGAQIILHNKPVNVYVTVDDNTITDVRLANLDEAQAVLYPLIMPTMDSLSKDIVRYQTTDVSTPKDAAVTGQLLLDAVNLALSQAYMNTISTGVQ